ncbi:arrestin domain-containing protein 17-like isoform X2 [Dreissena polymorpha]|uniref:arrestin domain-containing protein 17-like isoform X2 n=1 Tax=Dreissena polymorpha TaxID=45954 RepID=UPI002264B9C7|nr:arrestin domain-containing protein 17-like isoform X2 [Dreissena polymorpha]
MKLQNFDIQFDNPQGVFCAGHAVSGKIHVNLVKAMKVRSISLLFMGQAKTLWTHKHGKSKTKYSGREMYLEKTLTLFPAAGTIGDSIEHPSGNHAYPFSIDLLPSFPSSFEGKLGHVRYFCKATIDRPWKFNSQKMRAFTVIHHLDLNLLQNAVFPIHGEVTQTLHGCCCDAGEITASLDVGKSGFVPGEPLNYHIYIDNKTDNPVNKVFLFLIQLKVCSGSEKCVVSKPLFIGSIPLQDMSQPEPLPRTYVQPSAPAIVSPEALTVELPAGNTPGELVLPPSYEESVLPPPAYSECIFGRTPISDESEENATETNTDWAPSYPYYDYTLRYGSHAPGTATLRRYHSHVDGDDDDDDDDDNR